MCETNWEHADVLRTRGIIVQTIGTSKQDVFQMFSVDPICFGKAFQQYLYNFILINYRMG